MPVLRCEGDVAEPSGRNPATTSIGDRMTERTLILLRHAKSDWSGDEADIARPLAKRGRRQAPDAGRWLAANIDSIDLAVVSPASRARSTWDLVSARLDAPSGTRIDHRVYAASDHLNSSPSCGNCLTTSKPWP